MLNRKQFNSMFTIFFLLFLWGGTQAFSQGSLHNGDNQTLTAHLKWLKSKYGSRISFSSTITDGIYPQINNVTGTLEDALETLLAGTNLEYRVVNGYYYIYRVKPPIIVPPSKVIPETKPEKREELPPISSVPCRLTLPYQKLTTKLEFYPQIIPPVHADNPKLAVKTNLLYDITATVNLGIEVAIAKKWTIDISSNLNFWNFSSGNRKWKQAIIQPELRYWPCERFNGHFLGAHLHTGLFNVGALPALGGLISENMQQYRYQGYLYGGGFTYGYQTILSNHWSLETSIGIGYSYLKYDKYPCGNCGTKIKDKSKNYFGPTKVSIALIYNMK